jgi:hypothetical protein
MARRHLKTDNEKKAEQLNAMVSDLRTDLDLVGQHFGTIGSWIQVNRLRTIVEAAEEEKTGLLEEYADGIGKRQ